MEGLRSKKLLLDFDSMAAGVCPGADETWMSAHLAAYDPVYKGNFLAVQREVLGHLDSLCEGGTWTEVFCASNRQSAEIDRNVAASKAVEGFPTGSAFVGLARIVAEKRPDWRLNKHLLADSIRGDTPGTAWDTVALASDGSTSWPATECPIPERLTSPMGAALKVELVMDQIRAMDPEEATDIHFVDDAEEYGVAVARAFQKEQEAGRVSSRFTLKSWVVYWQGLWNDMNHSRSTESIREASPPDGGP